MRSRRFFALVVLVCLVMAGLLYAGPLDPPVGPIVSTNKTLTEVEPRTAINAVNTPGDADSVYKITQPGSYYLTGNITGAAGKSGIEIASDYVTIDLDGFTVKGVAGALSGITSAGIVYTGVTIHDGTVREWPQDGVFVLGSSHFFTRITSTNNTARGFASAFATFESCIAASNGGHGFNTSDNCRFSGCTARANSGNGFAANQNCVFERCIASNNALIGLQLASGAVTDCAVFVSGQAGISATSETTIHRCEVRANTGPGISATAGCTISTCSVNNNQQAGINAGNNGTVIDCTLHSNNLDGIVVAGGCLVRGNNCVLNGLPGDGAGIHATGTDNRIEGNTCSSADRGIDVDGAGNIIIRNTCSGNTTDWDIVANNNFGPILDRRAPASAAVTGFGAASTLGSTDANANFSF